MSGHSQDDGRLRRPGLAYLLSVMGSHSSERWQQRLGSIGMDPREMVVLRMVAAEPGRTQRSLGPALRVPASRIVAVIDGLEGKGLVERRAQPDDRRANALHLTPQGHELLTKLMEVSVEHEADLVEPLSASERSALERALVKLARHADLPEGGHPGFD